MRILLTAKGEWNIHAAGVLAQKLKQAGCDVHLAHRPLPPATCLPFRPSWSGPVLPMVPEQLASSELTRHVDAIGVFAEPRDVSQFCEVVRLTGAMAGTAKVPVFSGPVEPLSGDLLELDLLGRLGCDLLCLHGSDEQEMLEELTCRSDAAHRQRSLKMGWWQIPTSLQHGRQADDGEAQPSLLFVEQNNYPGSVTGKRQLLQWLEQLCAQLPDWKVIVQPDYGQPEDVRQLSNHSLARLMLTKNFKPRPELPSNLVLAAAGGLPRIVANATITATLTSTRALPALSYGRPVLVLADYGFSSAANSSLWMGSGLLHVLKEIAEEGVMKDLPPVNQQWLQAMGATITDGTERLIACLQELRGAR